MTGKCESLEDMVWLAAQVAMAAKQGGFSKEEACERFIYHLIGILKYANGGEFKELAQYIGVVTGKFEGENAND